MIDNIPWVESPFFEKLLEESSYSPEIKEQIKFFSEKGYLIIDPEIEGFDQKAQHIISTLSEEQTKYGSRVQDAWKRIPEVKSIACHPKVLEWLKILYGRKPIPFQTLNFSRGTEQATHSDLIHFSCTPARFMAGVWFALEDVDENNGALHYFPGSHKLPIFEMNDLGMSKSTFINRTEQYKKYELFVKDLLEKSPYKKEAIRIKKGSCLIWSANLFHGGDPIRDKNRTRHSQVNHYYFEGCRYYVPINSDVYLEDIAWKKIVDIQTGKKVNHLYNGKKVSFSLKTHARHFKEDMMAKSKFGRSILGKTKQLITKLVSK